jgi:predicted DsbA family dithiol-disulfide isomerase
MIEKLTIDIWSDVMCPWCVIGYHQLLKGLALVAGEIEAEIRWRPFELNPDMPPEGEEQGAHVVRKYGRSPEQVAAGREQMLRIAERAGCSLAWAGEGEAPPAMMRNTFLAHKLLAWTLDSAGPQAQTRLKLALFEAHFQHRRDVGDPAVLLTVAAEQGLEREGAGAALADEALGQRVRSEEAAAWDMNITGVPAMLVEGKFLIPGAQEPEVYADALRRVVARDRAAGTTA